LMERRQWNKGKNGVNKEKKKNGHFFFIMILNIQYLNFRI
jgi:hypothetical protein